MRYICTSIVATLALAGTSFADVTVHGVMSGGVSGNDDNGVSWQYIEGIDVNGTSHNVFRLYADRNWMDASNGQDNEIIEVKGSSNKPSSALANGWIFKHAFASTNGPASAMFNGLFPALCYTTYTTIGTGVAHSDLVWLGDQGWLDNGFDMNSGGSWGHLPSSPSLGFADNDAAAMGSGNTLLVQLTTTGNEVVYDLRIFTRANGAGHEFDEAFGTITIPLPAEGACCIGSSCSVDTEDDCISAGGTYLGDDSDCNGDPCYTPPAEGACCIGSSCSVDTEDDCISAGGTYLGDDSDCSGDPCYMPPAEGACCIGSSCSVDTEDDCVSTGGTYLGDDSDCSGTDPCGTVLHVPSEYSTIQGAINASSDGDTIAIAAGTYYEHTLNPNGKAITIGSASGNLDVTIDAQDGGDVFLIDSGEGEGTVIKDLVITGSAGQNELNNCWFGIHCEDSSPTITGCRIDGNSGGGIFCNYSRMPGIAITACVISNNRYAGGGGILGRYSDITLTDCLITSNSSPSDNVPTSVGGGIGLYQSDLNIIGGEISNNTADIGGGIYWNETDGTISDCTISGNTADNGGGIYVQNSNPTISDSEICGNEPDQIYGSWTDGGGNIVASECSFADGACCMGVGMCSLGTQAVCESFGGEYLGDGTNCHGWPCGDDTEGACCFENDCFDEMSHSTCDALGGSFLGDGLSCDGDIECGTGDNCGDAIIVGEGSTAFDTTTATDSGFGIPDESQCAGTYLYWLGINPDRWFTLTADCDGTMTVDTCDSNSYDTSLVLYSGSSCSSLTQIACNGDGWGGSECQIYYSGIYDIQVAAGERYFIRIGGYNGQTGSGTLNVTFDTDECTWGACCIGSSCSVEIEDDCISAGGTYLGDDSDCSGTDPCDTVLHVPSEYSTIQGAINASSDGDVIAIAAGTYYEHSLNPSGKAITIGSASGNLDVTIHAAGLDRVFLINSGEGNGTLIKDLVITGGDPAGSGAGIYCWNSNPTISNCTIEGNTAYYSGGGIYCYNSNPTISNCTIDDNTANKGGGIFGFSSNPTIIDCTISDNTAVDGGGIYGYNSNPTISDSEICGNEPDQINGSWTDGGGNTVADECGAEGCVADLNNSGAVDIEDLLLLIGGWGTSDGDCDDDGDTDIEDLLVLIGGWGACP